MCILTVVAIAGEQHVVPDEIRAAAELGPVGDEHFFDGRIIVDDDARHGAHGHGVDRPVLASQLGKPSERLLVVPGKRVQRAEYRVCGRAVENGLRGRTSASRRTPTAAHVVRDQRHEHQQQQKRRRLNVVAVRRPARDVHDGVAPLPGSRSSKRIITIINIIIIVIMLIVDAALGRTAAHLRRNQRTHDTVRLGPHQNVPAGRCGAATDLLVSSKGTGA